MQIRQSLHEIVEFYLFIIETFRQIFNFYQQKQIGFIVVLRQIMFTGYEALGLISFIALAIGGLIILEGSYILGNFGGNQLIYILLVTVVVRELSSIFTALIVIARSGTAIATELGNMVVHHEIDALVAIGISPISYLVVSRLMGVVIATFTLTIYFNLSAIIGGWLFSTIFYPVNFMDFFGEFIGYLQPRDLIICIIKSIIFGLAIALNSCYQGLRVRNATTEVPQKTIQAVVKSIVAVIFFDIVITALFYLI
jgi:phospholipid/cholesterol/gamma-HCH transport system permease protein